MLTCRVQPSGSLSDLWCILHKSSGQINCVRPTPHMAGAVSRWGHWDRVEPSLQCRVFFLRLFSLTLRHLLTHTLQLFLCVNVSFTQTHSNGCLYPPAPHLWSRALLQGNNESLPHTAASGLTLSVKDKDGETLFSVQSWENPSFRAFSSFRGKSLNNQGNGERGLTRLVLLKLLQREQCFPAFF